jgi:hypothetical protein
MRTQVFDDKIIITLSRRNLLALLQKVDLPPGQSACTIMQESEEGHIVSVTAEPDEVHYQGRTPGRMRGDAETFIAGDS